MSIPRISIIMPVFNGAAWLRASLGSVERQKMEGCELIVVDDGSTDDSAKEVERLAPNAIILRQTNQGAAAARNVGLQQARGDCVAFLDHDDIWPDGSLQARWDALERDAKLMMAIGRTRFVGGEKMPVPWISPNLGAGLFRRDLFTRLGGLDQRLRLLDDVDLFLRIRESGVPYVALEEVTLLYRRGTGGLTQGQSWRNPELLAAVRASLARRREGGAAAREMDWLSGSRDDPRAAGPVNHGDDRAKD